MGQPTIDTPALPRYIILVYKNQYYDVLVCNSDGMESSLIQALKNSGDWWESHVYGVDTTNVSKVTFMFEK